jgi:hypothetical protein
LHPFFFYTFNSWNITLDSDKGSYPHS